jgi:single-strand DNA-binding protein
MRDVNSLNKVILVGRLGQNPEIRYLPQNERHVARFTLATNERLFNPGTNESSLRTEWHRVVVWGKLAEFCEKFLTKGKQILLEGKLRTRSWQDKSGNKRTTTEVEAVSIVLLGKREEVPGEVGAVDTVSADFPAEDEPPSADGGASGEDDVPF